MNVELKPCPFCGAPAERYPDGDMEGYSISCSGRPTLFGGGKTSCPLSTFAYETQSAADAAWNNRAPITAPAPTPSIPR